MKLKGKRIGYVLTGSFCTFSKTIPVIKELVKNGAEVIPIMSYNSYNLDTKFGKAQDFIKEIEEITGKKNNTHNTRSRTNWTKKNNGHNGNSTMLWKHYLKTSL